jgi:hypothetical protein
MSIILSIFVAWVLTFLFLRAIKFILRAIHNNFAGKDTSILSSISDGGGGGSSIRLSGSSRRRCGGDGGLSDRRGFGFEFSFGLPAD